MLISSLKDPLTAATAVEQLVDADTRLFHVAIRVDRATTERNSAAKRLAEAVATLKTLNPTSEADARAVGRLTGMLDAIGYDLDRIELYLENAAKSASGELFIVEDTNRERHREIALYLQVLRERGELKEEESKEEPK